MESCPPEILQQICGYLSFDNLRNLRLVCSVLAQAASHGLVSKIRFHCSQESFERLKAFADHDIFRQQITKLVFEANLLAFLACKHEYRFHFMQDHHKIDRPVCPPSDCSSRARRCWQRNLKKFDEDINTRFQKYNSIYLLQQEFIHSEVYKETISYAIERFPNLSSLKIYNADSCYQTFSSRFSSAFRKDCSIPIDYDTSTTKAQLQMLLVNDSQKTSKVKTLSADGVSHLFFSATFQLQDKVVDAFRGLKDINIQFRLESDDHMHLHLHPNHNQCFSGLQAGGLRTALAASSQLESLCIGFGGCLCQVDCTDIRFVIGDAVWPHLKFLRLDSLVVRNDDLLTKLKRQPMLKDLQLGYIKLADQSWIDVIDLIKVDTNLAFLPFGILEDSEEQYFTDWVDRYCEDLEDRDDTLAWAISFYTGYCRYATVEEVGVNPLLLWEDYAPPDVVADAVLEEMLNGSDGTSPGDQTDSDAGDEMDVDDDDDDDDDEGA